MTTQPTKPLCLDDDFAASLRTNRMSESDAKSAAASAAALADPTRVEVADALARAERPLCVADVAWAIERPQNVVSHHLRLLQNVGMATSTRDGKKVMYALTTDGNKLLTEVAGELVEQP